MTLRRRRSASVIGMLKRFCTRVMRPEASKAMLAVLFSFER
jgi:hypothetical protein